MLPEEKVALLAKVDDLHQDAAEKDEQVAQVSIGAGMGTQK